MSYWTSAVMLLSGLAVITAPAQASEPRKPMTAQERVNKASRQPMKQDYAGALPVRTSSSSMASDTRSQDPRARTGRGGKAEAPLGMSPPAVHPVPGEIVSDREATATVHRNADGTVTRKQYFSPQFFRQGDEWRRIDTRVIADTDAYDTGRSPQSRLEGLEGFSQGRHYSVAANEWVTRFAPSDFPGGMVRLQLNGSGIGFKPVDARRVTPAVSVDGDGKQRIVYRDLWPGVDVEYRVYAAEIKENIVLKHRDAAAAIAFEVLGAVLRPGGAKDGPAFTIRDALNNEFGITPVNLILNNFGFVSDTSVYGQQYRDRKLHIFVDRSYLRSLPDNAFPAVIDPGVYRSHFGNRAGGNYVSFKSDGYICPSNVCNLLAGSLQDTNYAWRSWRGAFHSPYEWFRDPSKRLVHANLHLTMRSGVSWWPGTTDGRWIDTWHANCLNSYNCVDWGLPGGETHMGSVGDIDVTNIYRTLVATGNFGGWLMITGEEGAWVSYKNFDPDHTYVDFTFYDPPAPPGIAVPASGQTYIDPQASFKLNPVGNPNNGDPLEYEFLVSSNPGASGALINSGVVNTLQWTVPDGILQDGSTYYLQVRSFDNTGGGLGPWSASVPFKIDLRTGKDSTQTFDTLGPVSVDLATGNLTTSASSHSSAALGGSMGVSLDYNSPLRSRSGLVAEYWNNMDRSGNPVMSRVDQSVDFAWDHGSPLSGAIVNDYYSARWTGYFMPPVTGSYQFGSVNDDAFTVKINGQVVHAAVCCSGTPYFNGSPVSLTAGQPVPIVVEYHEHTGPAYARLMVKGAVSEQIVRSQWLQTGIRPTSQPQGLIGRYYHDDGSHNFTTNTALFMQRVDSLLNFDWYTSPAVAGGPADNFLVRWTGSLTVPRAGSYQFGSVSDDGVRIKINEAVVQENWTDHGATESYGNPVTLTAGQSVPITVEYYEHGGGALLALKVKGPDGITQIVPSSWLSPRAQVLPDGWSMGIDPDGDLSYDRIKIMQNSAILTDSTGSTHEYTWTGSGYKPPVNEDGQLVRNADGTFTLQDVDGRTYVFGADGLLASVTSPLDDRKPAALRYTYSGYPAKITEITDGVTPNRWARVYYSGNAECGDAPSGYDAQPPANMLCAVKTNDGRATHFYYKAGQLARVAEPGNELLDFGYEQLPNGSYRLIAVRDAAANDAVAAGVRTDDTSVLTEISYDALGRVTSVTQPAPTTGAHRIQHTVEYLPSPGAAWTTPEVIEGALPTGSPNLLSWGDNRLALFARHGGSDLKYRVKDHKGWSNWQLLDTACILDDPGAASWEPGRIDVFVRGCDNQLHTKVFHNGNWSSGYIPLGSTGITSSPSATSWGKDRYDVVARGPNNQLMHRWWGPTSGWSGFGDLGGCIAQAPTVSTWGYDRLNIYVQGCGQPGSFFSKYWVPSWSDFAVLTNEQNLSSAPQSVSRPDKHIHIVARGADGALRYLHFDGPAWAWDGGWQTVQNCIVGSPAISQLGDTTVVVYKGCDGQLYETRRVPIAGVTKQHVAGAPQPYGFTRQVTYDTILRTIEDRDIANLATKTEWHPIKDLLHSNTDAAGLKATTIYDDDDRQVESYGPAPAGWFAAGGTPQTAHANKVSRVATAYDEGILGGSVAWHNVKSNSLFGAPKLHTTGIDTNQPTWLGRDFRVTNSLPFTPDAGMDGYGFSVTGKVRFPGSGTYTLKLWHDDGARVWLDDRIIIDNWSHRSEGATQSAVSGTFVAQAGKPYRFRFDYLHVGNPGALELWAMGPGITDTNQGLGISRWPFLTPGYGLQTSTKTYDAELGTSETRTSYGPRPELGLVHATTIDPQGLNLTTTMTYEAPEQADGYLRQTSKTLPGGGTTTYSHYTGGETRDNPCTTEVEAYQQAGFMKFKTEPDPDGSGNQVGRRTETIYDDAGRVVAMRYNNDGWTCTSHDARGRIAQTIIPQLGNEPGRTVRNNWAVGGNPLATATGDGVGDVVTVVDLLGRVIGYTDAHGDATTSSHDDLGRLMSRSGPLGEETFVYDDYHRLIEQKLDGAVIAAVSYDQFGRMRTVQYPTTGQVSTTLTRDQLGRSTGLAHSLDNGATVVTDTVTYSQSSQILSNVVRSGTRELTASYGYDSADRLVSAQVGSRSHLYGFGQQDPSCGTGSGTNSNAGKSSNRTSQTVDGVTTHYCYDHADRVIGSSDATYSGPTYDTHGNLTRIGTAATPLWLGFDSSDRNWGFEQYDESGNGVGLYYTRDVHGRVIGRHKNDISGWNWQQAGDWFYGFTGTGDSPDIIRNQSWDIIEKSLALPGGTLLTVKPQETLQATKHIYSLPNLHGDILLTVNGVGENASTGPGPANSFIYDPFGSILTSSSFPSNTAVGSYAYVGQHQKAAESLFSLTPIQMGVRVYLPKLGRFAQVDPIEGGTENSYVYPADPVNEFDLTGQAVWFAAIAACIRFCKHVIAAVRAAPKVWRTVKHVANHNNFLRIGQHANNFRVAAGPARHYHVNRLGPGHGITRHVHVEWRKVLYQNHRKGTTKCWGKKCW